MFVYEILNTGLIEQSKLSLTKISMHTIKSMHFFQGLIYVTYISLGGFKVDPNVSSRHVCLNDLYHLALQIGKIEATCCMQLSI